MSRAPTSPLRVAVLHGGPSSEHDISVMSAREVIASLRAGGHHAESVWVGRDGAWHFTGAEGDAGQAADEALAVPEALARLRDAAVDCAFLGFHGTYGEDGRIQGALELAGVPFTGSGLTATALAMDKPLARRVLGSAGIQVPEGRSLRAAGVDPEADADDLIAELGLPLVVKVAAGGSSLGVEIPQDRAAVVESLARLAPTCEVLLCERFVVGVELTAGVLERHDGSLEALPVVEIAPRGEGFFDYEAKYDPSLTDEIVPARISPEAEAAARRIGERAHHTLGCRGLSRTDLILDADGALWTLETNTLPGLTPASLLPKSAAAAGCDYLGLLERIIGAAIRHQQKG